MNAPVQRNFLCPANEKLCSDANCTKSLCRMEAQAKIEGRNKELVKSQREATALPRQIVAEFLKSRKNSK